MKSHNRMLLAMFFAMLVGYMPWYNFSAVLKYLSDEYHLTAADTGFILSAFQAGYVIVVVCIGWLADRISLKKILFCATFGTGLFSTLFIWGAQGKLSILVFRLLTGLSAGAIYIPGLALLSRWFPPQRRGAAMGIYNAGLVAAYAGGYLVASHLAVNYGWKAGILWTSLPAFLGALVIYFFVSDFPEESVDWTPKGRSGQSRHLPAAPPPGAEKCDLAPARGPRTAAAEGLAAPAGGFAGPALISGAYMGHMWELYAFWGWIGPFLIAALISKGIATNQAVSWGGAVTAGIILLGAPSSWLWGIVADKKGRTFALIVAGVCSVAGEIVIGFLFGHSLALLLIAGGWLGFWGISDGTVYKAGLVEMVNPRICGLCLGLQSGLGFGITIISPAVFGTVLQWYNGKGDPTSATIWAPAFLILALGGLLAPIMGLVLRRFPQARLMCGGKM
ncbi:MAG: MFS transporter [Desulfobaccales bacterium]